jgi:AhpD family alkylhydroperoxidase
VDGCTSSADVVVLYSDVPVEEVAMTSESRALTRQQEELVALGASIGLSCSECFDSHAEAARAAGLSDDEVRAAVTSAESVAGAVAAELLRRIRSSLGLEESPSSPPPSVASPLAALGAAIVMGDRSAIDRHMQAAAGLGLSRSALHHAVQVASRVQAYATDVRRLAARAVLSETAGGEMFTTSRPWGEDCMCGFGGGTESTEGERQHIRRFACCG